MSKQKKYWNSIQHLEGDAKFVENANKEFAEYVPVDEFLSDEKIETATTSRRDFLKFLGFSVSAATLAACETPVTKSIPYVNKPHEITPGIANYYASTYYDGNDYASILVKTREGRPILIEGNEHSTVSKGASARVNTSVLDLYDSKRVQGPLKGKQAISWKKADAEIKEKLNTVAQSGKQVVLLSSSMISPTSKRLLSEVSTAFNGAFKHVVYDAISYSGLLDANEKTLGSRVIPTYRFDKSKVTLAIGADFLEGWLLSSKYAADFAKVRNPEAGFMTKHYQIESKMSLTGANADERYTVKPSEQSKVTVLLYNELAKKAGVAALKASSVKGSEQFVAKIANDLWSNKGASLVVSASNDVNTQLVVNKINELLGNYGTTLDVSAPTLIKQGKDKDMLDLIQDINSGKVGAVLTYGVDPAFNLPASLKFAEAYAKLDLSVALSYKLDHTAKISNYVAPVNHYLESWDDAEPISGSLSLTQPVIGKLFDTRQWQDSLMKWASVEPDYYTYLQNAFKAVGGQKLWNTSVHDGVAKGTAKPVAYTPVSAADIAAAGEAIFNTKTADLEVELYYNVTGDGTRADNPWLQELPDPVSKVVWDNYIAMSPSQMKELGLETNIQQEIPANLATVKVGSNEVTLPVFPSPGQAKGAISIALGYGKALVKEELVGKNVANFIALDAQKQMSYHAAASLEGSTETYLMASSQTHHTIMDVDPKDPEKGRKIVNETTLEGFAKGREHYNPLITLADAYGEQKTTKELNLWEDHPYDTFGHRWGMSIDLNACNGCSACVTACHSENNVPVVGKDEVRRNRDMFWLRIDRYYSSDMNEQVAKENELGAWEMYSAMEQPSDNPQVVFQPVMCQHCNHAPCETVCPVAATTHSNEGLNQMTYNRCVGTRYCANNCPYKVRRFNWFQYDAYDKFTGVNPAQDDLSRMVLNPDVTVRSRGVMEKCSMCVQRIQAGKLDAKKKKQKVQDGAIKTACQTACPTNAISFGDLNDQTSEVRAKFNDDRAYFLLEEVGTQPNVSYMTKVRNIKESQS